jgi:hypothetical protein
MSYTVQVGRPQHGCTTKVAGHVTRPWNECRLGHQAKCISSAFKKVILTAVM